MTFGVLPHVSLVAYLVNLLLSTKEDTEESMESLSSFRMHMRATIVLWHGWTKKVMDTPGVFLSFVEQLKGRLENLIANFLVGF